MSYWVMSIGSGRFVRGEQSRRDAEYLRAQRYLQTGEAS